MEVKGTAVIAIRDYVKKNFDNDYANWLDSLSPESKSIFTSMIDSTKWYPVEYGAKEPTEKISLLFFNDNLQQAALASGRYSAENALTGIYKIFVKAANPSYIIKRASRVFATYYQPCELKVVAENNKSVVLEICKLENRFEAIENRIIGWIQEALEISGCKNVSFNNQEVRQEEEGIVLEINFNWN